MVRRSPRPTQSGLTIVELLVTIVIASVVSAATFMFFAGQQKIYDVQTELLNMQQNLWASMETLARYARASGGGMSGCVRPDSDGPGPDQGDPVPGGAAMPQTGLRVWRSPNFSRVPPLWIQNGVAGAPDTLTVAYGDGSSGGYTDAMLLTDIPAGQSTGPIVTLPGQSGGFRVDEFGLLVDRGQANLDRGCMLFQITGIVAPDTLLHSAATSDWNTLNNQAAMMPFTYDGDPTPNVATGGVRNFGRLFVVQFAINSVGAPATPPTLTMNVLTTNDGPQVLAEGIEDLQVAYACDLQPLAPDGLLREGTDPASRLADEWIYNETGDVVTRACIRPDAIRITLIARSMNTDTLLSDFPGNAKPSAEDGVAGPVDLFRHRAATTTVYPRN
jgi:prepilin-type N-terminal cleavage/methylation domain-containing protein